MQFSNVILPIFAFFCLTPYTVESYSVPFGGVSCNPCTEVLKEADGYPICFPKYGTIYVPTEDCSCACGQGTQTVTKKCVAYHEDHMGSCQTIETSLNNCPDGPATKTQACNNGNCAVSLIVEKTATNWYSSTADEMTYTAYTGSGQSCLLGIVKKNNKEEKQRDTRGAVIAYGPDDMENAVCKDICLAEKEVFDHITITIDGTDGWLTEYVQVFLNGHSMATYKNPDWLDTYETKVWTKEGTPLFCNPCTQVVGYKGQPACIPKYDAIYAPNGDCSCHCGPGTQTVTKKCVAYREDGNGKCKQINTALHNCPDGPATKTQACNNGNCAVSQIVEKTDSSKWSNSLDDMTYTAYTRGGQSCRLGLVKNKHRPERELGSLITYGPADIDNTVCEDICLAKDGVFDHLSITISGSDGWLNEYIQVFLNTAMATYKNPEFLDEKDTMDWINDQQTVSCDPCTQVVGEVAGQPACLPKYDVIYQANGDCSCYCGKGTQTVSKKCVAYQVDNNGKCTQIDTGLENCPKGPATKKQSCNNRKCAVSKIVEKTNTAYYSGTSNEMTYTAHTNSGQSCLLGILKKENLPNRYIGGVVTYGPADIAKPVCEDICMAEHEVFDHISISIDGTDGWLTEYIQVFINGAMASYKNPDWLDDNETKDWIKAIM